MIQVLRELASDGPLKNSDAAQSASSSTCTRQRQLLVDVSVILQHDARTGIQRVVRAMWLNLRLRRFSDFVVKPVFATSKHPYSYARYDFLESPDETNRHQRQAIDVGSGDVFLCLDLSAHLLPRHEPQVRELKKRGASVHMFVYDLLPITGAAWFNWKTRRNFAKWLAFILRQADQAICISGHVANELRQWMEVSGKKRTIPLGIKQIRLGADIAATGPTDGVTPSDQALLADVRKRPFILMVGTIEPRKGHEVALNAFEKLWQDYGSHAPNLVIAGKPGWKTKALQRRLRLHPEAGKRLTWFESASDEFLESLYRACTGVLLTSYAEGFGLPVVEAVSYGKPVLLRDIPVFREFGYSSIAYFNDDRPEPLAARIMEWIGSAKGEIESESPPNWAHATDDLVAALGLSQIHTHDHLHQGASGA